MQIYERKVMLSEKNIFCVFCLVSIDYQKSNEKYMYKFLYKKEVSHECQIRKEMFPKKRLVSNRAIFDCTNFSHDPTSQLNLTEQFCSILCKLFILDISFSDTKSFFSFNLHLDSFYFYKHV